CAARRCVFDPVDYAQGNRIRLPTIATRGRIAADPVVDQLRFRPGVIHGPVEIVEIMEIVAPQLGTFGRGPVHGIRGEGTGRIQKCDLSGTYHRYWRLQELTAA